MQAPLHEWHDTDVVSSHLEIAIGEFTNEPDKLDKELTNCALRRLSFRETNLLDLADGLRSVMYRKFPLQIQLEDLSW